MSNAMIELAHEAIGSGSVSRIVDCLDEVLYLVDARGCWAYLSASWQRQFGWQTMECMGRLALRYVHPEDRMQIFRSWAELIRGERLSCHWQLRIRDAAGKTQWMLTSARPVIGGDGKVCGVAGTLVDISAVKTAESEMAAARASAESANRAKSEFLSTMSHELRTPLNAVIGLTESLLESGAPFEPDRTKRYLGIIHGSGRQLLAQINDILDLARIDAGRIKVNADVFDARVLATGAVEGVQREARHKRIQVKVTNPAGAVWIRADERLLRQAMQNLVSNAVKFTPEGGAVEVTLELHARGVGIRVKDSGIGIAADKMGLLFKPFSQVDGSFGRAFGGTGLGLALVQRIARLHSGEVAVESTVGKGSVFEIRLPRDVVDGAADSPRFVRSKRVLLVDDDPHQHVVVADYLRRHGFAVESCTRGESALHALATAEPGLAIVDVNMPDMKGHELIARLRASPTARDIPILAVTALVEGEQVELCRVAGADVHLSKPISLRELAQHIERLTACTV